MNKTSVKVLQILIRDNFPSVKSIANQLSKAKTTIYDCMAELRQETILSKENKLRENDLTKSLKLLFLKHPYDFSFLTKTNLKVLSIITAEHDFQNIIKTSKLSRYTVHQLLRNLKKRGFVNRKNKLTQPKELIAVINTLQQKYIELPASATVVFEDNKRKIIQATKKTILPLKPTAFSAFNIMLASPYNYYTTKKRPSKKDIFEDAKVLSSTKREKLLTALFYKKNIKQKDEEYEKIIKSPEFREIEKDYG